MLHMGTEILQSIHKIGNIYSDTVKLSQCGFVVEECNYDPRFGTLLEETSPFIDAQDEKAEELGSSP